MSNLDELKRFENDLRGSEELRKRMDETVKRIVDEGKAANDGEMLVAAAKELGYDISIAALEQAKVEAEELDPEALEAVAGGEHTNCPDSNNYYCFAIYGSQIEDEYGHDFWCATAWHCYAITLHTESKAEYIACLYDFNCCSWWKD